MATLIFYNFEVRLYLLWLYLLWLSLLWLSLLWLIFYNFEVIEARGLGLRPDFFSLKDWGVPDFCQLVLFSTPQVV